MKIIKALTLSLGELSAPLVTPYQLGVLIHQLYRHKTYNGEKLNIQKDEADRRDYSKYLRQLLSEGILSERSGFPSGSYSFLGLQAPDAEDLVCSIDPFCYVSHLSAMGYHGLTDRIPSKLHISSPSPKDWRSFAKKQMKKDLGEQFESYMACELPVLSLIKFEKIGRTEVYKVHSKHLGAFKNVRGRAVRVSTIGRTFLDMLRKPDLCGGINHVLQTYDVHAERYLRLITDEVDQNGNKIEKVRAGYILDERLSLKSDTVEGWKQYVQRGGSRKLDASSEYIPEWSDKWCLSLNIFE